MRFEVGDLVSFIEPGYDCTRTSSRIVEVGYEPRWYKVSRYGWQRLREPELIQRPAPDKHHSAVEVTREPLGFCEYFKCSNGHVWWKTLKNGICPTCGSQNFTTVIGQNVRVRTTRITWRWWWKNKVEITDTYEWEARKS